MFSLLLWSLAGTGAALGQLEGFRTIHNPPPREEFASGRVMADMMKNKTDRWAARRAAGQYDSSRFSALAYTPCVDGRAGEFKCNNIDLYSFMTHEELGSFEGFGSSSWGWSYQGREFAIIAQSDGAAFAEVTADGQLDYLGRLPQTQGAPPSEWRELRVMRNTLVVGSEAARHHIQVFDLLKILAITPEEKPKTFNPTTDAATWRGLTSGPTHNVVVNDELEYAVAVGSSPRGGRFNASLVFIDLRNNSAPTLLGFQAEDGYVHDAQCLVYRGPDTRFVEHDVCYGYNEDTLTIYDVTNKTNGVILSRTSYTGVAYTHQGSVLNPQDQRYLLMDDELDEVRKTGPAADGFPVTYIWDIQDLTRPFVSGSYKSSVKGVDHNQYVYDGKAYQSNYGSGLRILDVSSIPSDPTGAGVTEIGFFDIYPEDDHLEGGGAVDMPGSWSSHHFRGSGYTLINTMERGAYIVKLTTE